MPVSVTVTSTYALQTVTAQVSAGAAVQLTPPASSDLPWKGNVDTAALPGGTQNVTFTATDTLGNVGTVTQPFRHNNPPVIKITSPLDSSVARPTIDIAATCTDDTGCLNLRAEVESMKFASSGSSIDQSGVDLSAYDGQIVNLVVSADDADGSTGFSSQLIYVDTSPRLVARAAVDGTIWDFDATRLLYRKNDGAVVIRDRINGLETIIGNGTPAPRFDSGAFAHGVLSSNGAAWFSGDGCQNSTKTWVWRAGSTAQVAAPCGTGAPFSIAGDWGAGPYSISGNVANVRLTDFQNATSTLIAFPLVNDNMGGAAVTSTGDIFALVNEASGSRIDRYHDGAITKFGSSATGDPEGPLTDGINIAYRFTAATGYTIALFTNGAEQLLIPPVGGSNFLAIPKPVRDYQLNGGWTAYRQLSPQNVEQVWVRSPAGELTQLSVYNTDSTIEAISPTGQVMFQNGNHRYLRLTAGLPDTISSWLGTAVARCDGWHVIMGNTLFQVSDSADAGAGCVAPPEGTPDAGPPSGAGPDATATSGGGGAPGRAPDGGTNGEPGSSGGGGCAVGPSMLGSWGPLLGLGLALGALGRRRYRRTRRQE